MINVYRNARYELRLTVMETRIAVMETQLVALCDGLEFAMNSLQALSRYLKTQSDALLERGADEGSARVH